MKTNLPKLEILIIADPAKGRLDSQAFKLVSSKVQRILGNEGILLDEEELLDYIDRQISRSSSIEDARNQLRETKTPFDLIITTDKHGGKYLADFEKSLPKIPYLILTNNQQTLEKFNDLGLPGEGIGIVHSSQVEQDNSLFYSYLEKLYRSNQRIENREINRKVYDPKILPNIKSEIDAAFNYAESKGYSTVSIELSEDNQTEITLNFDNSLTSTARKPHSQKINLQLAEITLNDGSVIDLKQGTIDYIKDWAFNHQMSLEEYPPTFDFIEQQATINAEFYLEKGAKRADIKFNNNNTVEVSFFSTETRGIRLGARTLQYNIGDKENIELLLENTFQRFDLNTNLKSSPQQKRKALNLDDFKTDNISSEELAERREAIANALSDFLKKGGGKLFDNQKEIIEEEVIDLKKVNTKANIRSTGGSGKTMTYASTINAIRDAGIEGKQQILVPWKKLADQTKQKAFIELLGVNPDDIGILHGEMTEEERQVALSKPILITTYASYRNLIDKGPEKSGYYPKDYIYTALDESHAIGEVTAAYIKAHTLPNSITHGFTATNIDAEGRNVSEKVFDRKKAIYDKNLRKSVAEGRPTLAMNIKNIVIDAGGELAVDISGKNRDYTEKELDTIIKSPGRREAAIAHLESFADEVTGKKMKDERSFWVTSKVENAASLADDLNDKFGEGYAVYIHSKITEKEILKMNIIGSNGNQVRTLDGIEQAWRDGIVKAVASAGLWTTGFDMPELGSVYMETISKSPTRVEQSGLRSSRFYEGLPTKYVFNITQNFEKNKGKEQIFFGEVAGGFDVYNKTYKNTFRDLQKKNEAESKGKPRTTVGKLPKGVKVYHTATELVEFQNNLYHSRKENPIIVSSEIYLEEVVIDEETGKPIILETSNITRDNIVEIKPTTLPAEIIAPDLKLSLKNIIRNLTADGKNIETVEKLPRGGKELRDGLNDLSSFIATDIESKSVIPDDVSISMIKGEKDSASPFVLKFKNDKGEEIAKVAIGKHKGKLESYLFEFEGEDIEFLKHPDFTRQIGIKSGETGPEFLTIDYSLQQFASHHYQHGNTSKADLRCVEVCLAACEIDNTEHAAYANGALSALKETFIEEIEQDKFKRKIGQEYFNQGAEDAHNPYERLVDINRIIKDKYSELPIKKQKENLPELLSEREKIFYEHLGWNNRSHDPEKDNFSMIEKAWHQTDGALFFNSITKDILGNVEEKISGKYPTQEMLSGIKTATLDYLEEKDLGSSKQAIKAILLHIDFGGIDSNDNKEALYSSHKELLTNTLSSIKQQYTDNLKSGAYKSEEEAIGALGKLKEMHSLVNQRYKKGVFGADGKTQEISEILPELFTKEEDYLSLEQLTSFKFNPPKTEREKTAEAELKSLIEDNTEYISIANHRGGISVDIYSKEADYLGKYIKHSNFFKHIDGQNEKTSERYDVMHNVAQTLEGVSLINEENEPSLRTVSREDEYRIQEGFQQAKDLGAESYVISKSYIWRNEVVTLQFFDGDNQPIKAEEKPLEVDIIFKQDRNLGSKERKEVIYKELQQRSEHFASNAEIGLISSADIAPEHALTNTDKSNLGSFYKKLFGEDFKNNYLERTQAYEISYSEKTSLSLTLYQHVKSSNIYTNNAHIRDYSSTSPERVEQFGQALAKRIEKTLKDKAEVIQDFAILPEGAVTVNLHQDHVRNIIEAIEAIDKDEVTTFFFDHTESQKESIKLTFLNKDGEEIESRGSSPEYRASYSQSGHADLVRMKKLARDHIQAKYPEITELKVKELDPNDGIEINPATKDHAFNILASAMQQQCYVGYTTWTEHSEYYSDVNIHLLYDPRKDSYPQEHIYEAQYIRLAASKTNKAEMPKALEEKVHELSAKYFGKEVPRFQKYIMFEGDFQNSELGYNKQHQILKLFEKAEEMGATTFKVKEAKKSVSLKFYKGSETKEGELEEVTVSEKPVMWQAFKLPNAKKLSNDVSAIANSFASGFPGINNISSSKSDGKAGEEETPSTDVTNAKGSPKKEQEK